MRRRYWITLGVVVGAVAAAGSAVAATKLESPSTQSKAIIKDAAGRLHVTPGALSSALKQALDDRIDAAVAAGRLSKQQGEVLKARVDKGQIPLVPGADYDVGDTVGGSGYAHPGFGFRNRGNGFGWGHAGWMLGPGLKTVISYLGITEAQLRSGFRSGKSLAQIAKAQGKTAEGLVAALIAAAKIRLDQAVRPKHLTSAQEKAILSRLPRVIKYLVNRTPRGFSDQHHRRFRFRFGGADTHP